MGKGSVFIVVSEVDQQKETTENRAKFVLTKKCRKSIVTPRNLIISGSLNVLSTFRKNLKSQSVRHSFLKPHVALCCFFPSN
jgi:hypothetical protein